MVLIVMLIEYIICRSISQVQTSNIIFLAFPHHSTSRCPRQVNWIHPQQCRLSGFHLVGHTNSLRLLKNVISNHTFQLINTHFSRGLRLNVNAVHNKIQSQRKIWNPVGIFTNFIIELRTAAHESLSVNNPIN